MLNKTLNKHVKILLFEAEEFKELFHSDFISVFSDFIERNKDKLPTNIKKCIIVLPEINFNLGLTRHFYL